MRKLVMLFLSIAFVFGACTKEETNDNNASSYPTDALAIDSIQRVLLVEQTGAWCQYCPNGAAIMIEMVGFYNEQVIAVAVHSGDPLTQPISGVWADNFPTTGVPNFHVMNEDAEQNPAAKIPAYIYEPPVLSLTHAVVDEGDTIRVMPKIKFYEDSYGEDYLVNSYVLLDAVLAKDYGNGIDLNQTSSVPIAGGNNPTKWLQDAAFVGGDPLIQAGDDYYHEHSLVGVANGSNPFGKALADANPFGRDYIAGDILGTKNTAIDLAIPSFSIAPFETDITIISIVWRLRTDGSGAFDYVNGYASHMTLD